MFINFILFLTVFGLFLRDKICIIDVLSLPYDDRCVCIILDPCWNIVVGYLGIQVPIIGNPISLLTLPGSS